MRLVMVLLVAVTAAGLATGTAAAATPPDLFVNNAIACSDTGPGTQADPFCTVQHAADIVNPGQTVRIVEGIYLEHVTLTRSGEPGLPITFAGPVGVENPPLIVGTSTALALTGVHDVAVSGLDFTGATAMTVTDSSDVTIGTSRLSPGTATGITAGLTLSGATSGVTLSRSTVTAFHDGVVIGAGVTGTVITTDFLPRNSVANVMATDAPGTVVTSNTAESSCSADVVLAGASTGSTVANDILDDVATTTTRTCPALLSVAAGSTQGTTADYNVVWATGRGGLYDWAGSTFDDPAAFDTATGQGGHDISADPKLDPHNTGSLAEGSSAVDSADADAPGELATDFDGNGRADDLLSPNTGTGSGFVDRGAFEIQDPYEFNTVSTDPVQSPAPAAVTVTAVVSNPWAEPAQYTYDFGDGSPTVTTSATSVPHTYTGQPRNIEISISVVTADGIHETRDVFAFTITAPAPLVAHLQASQTGVLNVRAEPTETDSFAVFGTGFSTDFGDGSAPVIGAADIEHKYTKPGTYTVTTTVTDQVGNTTTASQQVTVASGYAPVEPTRVLDTRNGTGVPQGKLGPGGVLTLNLAGHAGVPPTGATAVVLNVTATDASAGGVLTVFPDGSPKPTTSSVNFLAGQTIPNLVTVRLGADGAVDIANLTGTVDVVADIEGYYLDTGGALTVGFLHTNTPTRILDTRTSGGPIGAGGTRKVEIPGIPPAAVVLNVTVTAPSLGGVLTVWPDGQPRPGTSDLNFTKGETTSNLVIVPVADGSIDIGNLAGTAQVVVDMEGTYEQFVPPQSGFTPTSPTRLLDTRTTGGPLGAAATRTLQVAGVAGIPADATAVALNVTATGSTTGGFVSVVPHGSPKPTTSDLNFTPNETIANQVIVPIGTNGSLDLFNLAGTTNVIVDLSGYFQD